MIDTKAPVVTCDPAALDPADETEFGMSTKSDVDHPAPTCDFPDEPISLVDIQSQNNQDTFVINSQALALLESIHGKVAVIAMAGLYRTGKSSMLNWLLGKNRSRGFKVSSTVQRCTRGLWIWGHPIVREDPVTGETLSIVILDTEGLGGLEASQEYDVRLFSLATLLCSKLIYNSVGSIDDKAVSGLSFIANLTQHIQVSVEKVETPKDLSSYFPSFTWIVRDFSLRLVVRHEVVEVAEILNIHELDIFFIYF